MCKWGNELKNVVVAGSEVAWRGAQATGWQSNRDKNIPLLLLFESDPEINL